MDAACSALQAIGDPTDCDGLFIVEDVAICVEVKGRTIADPARRGDRARLATEIKAIFGEGARQARRLEQLISQNHGLWLGDGSWLDLAGIREVRSIVGLDFFGPLAVALGDLKRAGMLGEGGLPWIASLTTLRSSARSSSVRLSSCSTSVAGQTPVSPRTTGEPMSSTSSCCSWRGGLYVEPNPEEVQLQHPAAGSPRSHAQKQHQRDARPTFVGAHTDPLDAWMYWIEGTSPYEIEKPAFNTHPAARRSSTSSQTGESQAGSDSAPTCWAWRGRHRRS